MIENSQPKLEGVIEISFSVIKRADNVPATSKYARMLKNAADSQLFIFIEETGILVPIHEDFDPSAIEDAVNVWLEERLVVRGVAFSPREVLKKLKRLGFNEKSTEGSHVHLVTEERKGKVTVPVHSGTIKKGTLKSILNQAGIDLNTLICA